MKKYIFLIFSVLSMSSNAQQMMTPEKLWQLGRVTPIGISKDGKSLIYKVGTPNIQENKIVSKYYSVPVGGGNTVALDKIDGLVADKSISPNGQEYISVQQVKVEKILGSDIYPSFTKTSAQVYEGLDYRHWDTWNDGTHNHLFVGYLVNQTKKYLGQLILCQMNLMMHLKNHLVETKIMFGHQMEVKSFMYVRKKQEQPMQQVQIPIYMSTM